MNLLLLLNLASAGCAALSAAGWAYSATAPKWVPLAWLSGPPDWVVASIARTNKGNTIGATFAALAAVVQAAAITHPNWAPWLA